MSHLNIAFDRYAAIGTVMHYILVISFLNNGPITLYKIKESTRLLNTGRDAYSSSGVSTTLKSEMKNLGSF